MNRPLEGVKVVEVASWAYVPAAAAVLADWGADVIKVEPPTGDPMRGLASGGVRNPGAVVLGWEMFNRDKRAIALDLQHPQARDIVHQLVAEADVFLTSFLPNSRRKLQIDDETIRAINPRIVYAVGTGQGAHGPENGKGGFDAITYWSRGGVAAAVTPDGAEPAPLPSGAFGDSSSGMALAGGIAAALAKAARTGEGSVVTGSLLGTAMWSMQMALAITSVTGTVAAPRMDRANVRNPLVNTYPTRDGRWLALCMLQRDKFWNGLFEVLDRPDLIRDERFATPAARDAHVHEAAAELEVIFRTRSLEEWIPRLLKQSGQWDVVRHISELLQDRQASENGFFQWVEYDEGTRLPLVANPIQFDLTAPRLGRAPEFNADADAILAGLGWDEDRILDAKVIGAVV
jgi:crotonobetainyl-CoA:carnitine CoA-transferase CaiB-like acyl-CoA transferase